MTNIINESYLTNIHNLTLNETKKGLQLKDNKSNIKFILSFDEYSEILKNSRNHPLNKILKKDKLKILDCTGGFCKDSAIMSSLNDNVCPDEKMLFDNNEEKYNKRLLSYSHIPKRVV